MRRRERKREEKEKKTNGGGQAKETDGGRRDGTPRGEREREREPSRFAQPTSNIKEPFRSSLYL